VYSGLLLVIPVAAASTTTDMNKPTITASVFPSAPYVGDTVDISGTASGGNLTQGSACGFSQAIMLIL
jgi:hypothetical protein